VRNQATIVIIPGLRSHVADHWQTLLAERLSATRSVKTVPPLAFDKLNCGARVEAIQRTILPIEEPIIVVAHSAGVVMFLHWLATYRLNVKGALLATPPDFQSPLPDGYPTLETLRSNGWLPIPSDVLPFPSIVAASSNDPLASLGRVQDMARSWGSRIVNLGGVGHLNPASGFGPWLQAEDMIAALE